MPFISTFSFAIIAFVVAYYFAHLEHPKDVEVKISNIGIKVGGRKYPYSRIKAFWLIYEPPYIKTLNIRVSEELVSDINTYFNNSDNQNLEISDYYHDDFVFLVQLL